MRTKLSLLALLVFAAYALAQDVIHGRCVGVTDGDTIRALTADRQLLRIRVAWIDAPEMGQAFGQRAKQAMSELVFGKEVELHPHTIDRDVAESRLLGELGTMRFEKAQVPIIWPAYSSFKA